MRISQVWRQVANLAFDNEKHLFDLARTRTLLSNSVNQPFYWGQAHDTYCRSLARAHLSVSNTWFTSSDIQDSHNIILVTSIGEGKFAPLLERLNIHVEHYQLTSHPEFIALSNAFYPCPRLTHLTVPAMHLPVPTAPHLLNLTSRAVTISLSWHLCWRSHGHPGHHQAPPALHLQWCGPLFLQ